MTDRAAGLSVVIPAYDEESRIPSTLERVHGFLSERGGDWEIIVVDDGSADRTADVVSDFAGTHSRVRLLRAPHLGKGGAVRAGMLDSRAEYRFLCDADLSMPIEQIERFLERMDDCDVAIGSRECHGSVRVDEPFRRHAMGRAFNSVVRALAVPGIQDTQCGFKCFRGAVARRLFGRQRLDGFAFDVEVLFLALKERFRILEVPIDWHFREESKVDPLRDSVRMFRDVVRVRWNDLRGRYRVDPSRVDLHEPRELPESTPRLAPVEESTVS